VLTRVIAAWAPLHLHSTAIFYYCILAVLLGAQMLLAGLLAELIVSLSRESNQPYSVSQHAVPIDRGTTADEGVAHE
jgi:dolichol-phosphate mannosyltransferase